MKQVLKAQYEQAEIEIVTIESLDIITTSGDLGSGGDIDKDGWTSTGW